MASTLMTLDQAREHSEFDGLPDDALQRAIDAADADIRRFVPNLDNLTFSGAVIRATFRKGSGTTLRAADSDPIPGSDIKVNDTLTLGLVEYEGSPDYALTIHRSSDSTGSISDSFPTTGTYGLSVYVEDGEDYAEIVPRYLYQSTDSYAKWYVTSPNRAVLDGLTEDAEFEFVIASPGATPKLATYRSILIALVTLELSYAGLISSSEVGEFTEDSDKDYAVERKSVLTRLVMTQGRASILV